MSAFIHYLRSLVQHPGSVTEEDFHFLSCTESAFLGFRGVGLCMPQDSPLDVVVDGFPLELPDVGGQLSGGFFILQLE